MEARRCGACEQVFSGQARFCPFDGERLIDAPEWNPHEDPLIGKTIDGRYKVVSVLGEGETGKVYKVQHVALGRRFTLKVLRREFARDAAVVERFIREAQAAAAIGHPNIIAVSDFGELPADGSTKAPLPYFVMECLEGTSLAGLLQREGPLTAERAGPIFLQAASALSAAHAAGVIHRNLKPANLFITRTGDRDFVKLLDFGVAKIVGTGRHTKTGIITGTAHYMSPEQAAGAPIDLRVDVYALGVIMFEAFTGHVPFEGETYAEVLGKHINDAPKPIAQLVADRSALGAFDAITMRCLAKSPKDRFVSMADLEAAIERATGPLPAAIGRSPRSPAAKSKPKSPEPRRLGVVAATAIAAGVVLGVVTWLAMRQNPPREQVAPPGSDAALATSTAVASPEPAPSGQGSALLVEAPSAPPTSASAPPGPSGASSFAQPAAPALSPRPTGGLSPPSKPSASSGKRPSSSSDLVDPWATKP